ncbi:hypothetical protein Rleg9DRAFT_0552 [Rhizobium leguminosarum bv. trifolii WSM597]|uniref:Uncharacterized protein n=1 Tax=Rhizobium leguminosarum bv. trifolii WSM597 TaxID=754764 RepID=J0GW85_RHILT|nr:hypothetical protein Rleg9DRAFT_0552 [Rhizobium leguminosarum bv. trifolii WSM597]
MAIRLTCDCAFSLFGKVTVTVIAILGPADKTLVAEVIATGATQGELAEALHGPITKKH